MISRSEDKKFFLAETRRSATSAYEVVMRGYSVSELPRTIIPRAVFSSEGQRKELPVRMLSKKIGPAEAHRRNGETISWMLCFIVDMQPLMEDSKISQRRKETGYVHVYGALNPEELAKIEEAPAFRVTSKGRLDSSMYVDRGEMTQLCTVAMKDILKSLESQCFGITACLEGGTAERPKIEIHGWAVTDHEPDFTIKDSKTNEQLEYRIFPEGRRDITQRYPEVYSAARKQLYESEMDMPSFLSPGFRIEVESGHKNIEVLAGFHNHMLTWKGRVKPKNRTEAILQESKHSILEDIRVFGFTETRNHFRRYHTIDPKKEALRYDTWFKKYAPSEEKVEAIKKKVKISPSFMFLIMSSGFPYEDEKHLQENLEEQYYQNYRIARWSSKLNLKYLEADYIIPVTRRCNYNPEMLLEVVRYLDKHTDENIQLIYTDQDKYMNRGLRYNPWVKPDFNLDYLIGNDYISDLAIIEREAFMKVIKSDFLKQMDNSPVLFDLILRLAEREDTIRHLPKILVSVCERDESSIDPLEEEKEIEALQGFLDRKGYKTKVGPAHTAGRFHTSYEVLGRPLVSVILCGADSSTLTNPLMGVRWQELQNEENYEASKNPIWRAKTDLTRESFRRKSDYHNIEFIDTYDFMDEYMDSDIEFHKKCRVSDQCNKAVIASHGEYLLFIEAGITLLHRDSFSNMLGILTQRPDIGAVAGKIFCEDGTIRHGAYRMKWGSSVPTAYIRDSIYEDALFNFMDQTLMRRGVVLMRRRDFEMCGGFDINFAKSGMMQDMALRLEEKGLKCVYNGHAEFQLRSGRTNNAITCFSSLAEQKKEEKYFMEKWKDRIAQGDKYYSGRY